MRVGPGLSCFTSAQNTLCQKYYEVKFNKSLQSVVAPPPLPALLGIHILTLPTMNIGLYGQRTFMDVIKGLEIGDYPRLSGFSQNVFIRGRWG